MDQTPLYDALAEHARLRPAPFHMPGHKGRRPPFPQGPDLWALDLTELPDTGNLYVGGDAIQAAQDLWAAAWGFEACQFLTCGSTQGLHAALLLCAQEGRGVLVDRCCHSSVYNALGLLNLTPTYLFRRPDVPISPQAVGELLDQSAQAGEDIRTVCITSPTYYGVLSDIPAIADVCHSRGTLLAVDGAHGCHLPFLRDKNPFRGADLVVSSAHKTLPALGQGAVLLSEGSRFWAQDLRWAASVTGTSSPSYPVMASLDLARAYMESDAGLRACQDTVKWAAAFRAEFPALTLSVDPMRFTLVVDPLAADGFRVARALEGMGVFPEMADRDHLVFLFSPMNTREDYRRLWEELKRVEADWPGVFRAQTGGIETLEPPRPQRVLSPAQALTAPREEVELARAEGRVAAVQVAPYPPGAPIIAPGERIEKKSLSYLREVGYNVHERVDVVRD